MQIIFFFQYVRVYNMYKEEVISCKISFFLSKF